MGYDEDECTYGHVQALVVVKDINDCIEALSQTKTCQYRMEYENVIKQGRYLLLSVIRKLKSQERSYKLSMCPKEDMEREIFLIDYETELEEIKISHLRKEWNQQQRTMARLQDILNKKCRLLSLHSNYCSAQGEALSSILAILMENPELVESYLMEPETYLVKFIKIAERCLFSFIKTYSLDIPTEDNSDYRYILALYTCIQHISSLENGRQFLINYEDCQIMINEVIGAIPNLKHSSFDRLKLMLLRILYNITSENEGANFLKSCPELLISLDICIGKPYEPQMHKYLLHILERVTERIDNKFYLNDLTKLINTEKLQAILDCNYEGVDGTLKNILHNIKNAEQNFILEKQAQGGGDVLKDKSVGTPCTVNHTRSGLSKFAPSSMSSTCTPASTPSYSGAESLSTPHSQIVVMDGSLYSSSFNNYPVEGTIRPITRRDMFSTSTYDPLQLHASPCKVDASIQMEPERDISELDNTASLNIISDKFKTIRDIKSIHEGDIPKLSSEIRITNNDSFETPPETLDVPTKDTDVLSLPIIPLRASRDKTVQTYQTNSCISYVHRRNQSTDESLQPQKLSESKTKVAHSDFQYRKPTHCIKRNGPWSSGSKRRRPKSSAAAKKKSSIVPIRKEVSASSKIKVKTIEDSSVDIVNKIPSSASTLTTSTNTAISKNTLLPKVSEIETEMRACELSSERRLVPWSPQNRVVACLNDFNKQIGHYVKNTIRIISRLDNRTINRTQQRVVTRIKIPGMTFAKWSENNNKNS